MNKTRTVLITGGSSGIGLAIAKAFVAQGDAVVISGRNEERLNQAAKILGSGCAPVPGDVSDPETARKMKETALQTFGSLDVLVNNAGINRRIPFLQLEADVWKQMMAVNLDGSYYMLREILPHMAARKQGCVVNISSSAAKTPHPTAAASYGASKGALDALTRQLALEMAPYGIRVNAVCPGAVETEMTKQWSEEYRQKKLNSIPLGRLGRPEEVAALVCFLASDAAGYITGETININGGSYMD